MRSYRFHRSAATYDRHARPQQALARRVDAALPDSDPDRILELGAGTGLLTRFLLRRYPGAWIDALDIAPGMVAYGRTAFRHAPRVCWTVGDARRFAATEPYPLVVSSASLHWVGEMAAAFRTIRRNVAPGGRLVFGLMLAHTLKELRVLRREIAPGKVGRLFLPTLAQATCALGNAGFEVISTEHDERLYGYVHTPAFLRALHEQGVTGGSREDGYAPFTRGEMQRLMEAYEGRYSRPGGVGATYETAVITASVRQDPERRRARATGDFETTGPTG